MGYRNEGTPELRRALRIVRDYEIRTSRDMAEHFHPATDWDHQAMPAEESKKLVGGIIIDKLKTQKFILQGFPQSRIILSEKGRGCLDSFRWEE